MRKERDDQFAPLASLMPRHLRLVASDRARKALRVFGEQSDERPFTVKCCGWCFAPLGRNATDCENCGARFNG